MIAALRAAAIVTVALWSFTFSASLMVCLATHPGDHVHTVAWSVVVPDRIVIDPFTGDAVGIQ
jgi:hypothetical protein